MFKRVLKNRKGQAFVEYALLITGIAMVGLIGVTMLGLKTNDMVSALAVTIPGAEVEDNVQLDTGALLELANNGVVAAIDYPTILTNSNGFLDNNIGYD